MPAIWNKEYNILRSDVSLLLDMIEPYDSVIEFPDPENSLVGKFADSRHNSKSLQRKPSQLEDRKLRIAGYKVIAYMTKVKTVGGDSTRC
jgi:hypothetical protein